MEHIVVATWKAKDGQEDSVAELLRKLRTASLTEEGVLTYEVCQKSGDAGEFLVFERYTDPAAAKAHLRSPHFTELMPQISTLISTPKAEQYTPVE